MLARVLGHSSMLSLFFLRLALVLTRIGFLPDPGLLLPPLPFLFCAARLRRTALSFSFLVILAALAAGTHFAYPLFLPLVPHSG